VLSFRPDHRFVPALAEKLRRCVGHLVSKGYKVHGIALYYLKMIDPTRRPHRDVCKTIDPNNRSQPGGYAVLEVTPLGCAC